MNRSSFFGALRGGAMFPRGYAQGQVDGLNAILDEAGRRGAPLRHLAYILATAYHESAATMQPVRETLASTDERAILILEKAWKAGKLPWVKTPYWRKDKDGKSWLGRGLVQITHKVNYEKFGIASDPAAAMQMPVALRVLFDGMERGSFTGKKLSDFITSAVPDYYSARAIVNGDKQKNGAKTATHAKAFEAALVKAGYDPSKPTPAQSAPVSPAGNWLASLLKALAALLGAKA